MFRWYGFIGIILIVLAELNFIFKVEPFISHYFIIIWIGYVLVIDALVYKLRKRSLIMNNIYKFIGLFFLSAVIWWVFEAMNVRVGNWGYAGLEGTEALINAAWKTVYFSTVLPALFETYELIRSIHLFDKKKLHKKHKITKHVLHIMIAIGVITFILPIIFPKYFFPLIWITFFFILDPINYLHKKPSIIKHVKDRRLVIPLSLLLAGIIMGFLWEFWNFWALPQNKWTYSLPFFNSLKIFEMPILGYFGYFPFAFELYAMYFFIQSLFTKKEQLLRN